jgi:hypothetical protein
MARAVPWLHLKYPVLKVREDNAEDGGADKNAHRHLHDDEGHDSFDPGDAPEEKRQATQQDHLCDMIRTHFWQSSGPKVNLPAPAGGRRWRTAP